MSTPKQKQSKTPRSNTSAKKKTGLIVAGFHVLTKGSGWRAPGLPDSAYGSANG
jgi:hypothetical protein